MFFVASKAARSCVLASQKTSSRAASAAARAFGFGLIAAMTVYFYGLPVRAMEETLVVQVDQARVVKVPPGTETLVVGNASIADLTLLKQGAGMIVTGKGFGETNFIALDGAGNPLAQSLIRVVGAEMPSSCSVASTVNPIPARRNVCQPRNLATISNILARSLDR